MKNLIFFLFLFFLSFCKMLSLMQQLTQELEQDEARSFRPQVGSPMTNSPPGRNFYVPLLISEHNFTYLDFFFFSAKLLICTF